MNTPRVGSDAKAWTEVSTPERTRNVPSKESEKVEMASSTVQLLNEPRFADHDWAKRTGLSSYAGCPLVLEDKLVGLMAAFAQHPLTAQINFKPSTPLTQEEKLKEASAVKIQTSARVLLARKEVQALRDERQRELGVIGPGHDVVADGRHAPAEQAGAGGVGRAVGILEWPREDHRRAVAIALGARRYARA